MTQQIVIAATALVGLVMAWRHITLALRVSLLERRHQGSTVEKHLDQVLRMRIKDVASSNAVPRAETHFLDPEVGEDADIIGVLRK